MNADDLGEPKNGNGEGPAPRARRGLGRIYRRKKTKCWWLQYHHRGKLYRESSGSEHRQDAVRLLRKRLAEMGAGRVVGPQPEKVTFEDMAAMVLDDYRVNGRRSADRVGYSISHLRKAFGHDRAVDITTDRISRYVRDRQEAGAAPATVVQEIACLRRMFNLGLRAGKLGQRPYFPTIRVQNTRSGFFEFWQYEALMKHLPDYLQPPTEFMYLTGWRGVSEVFPLRWPQVDFQAGVVRLEPGSTKNDEGREFPFSALPALEALLRRQRELTTTLERAQGRVIPFVFHNRGRPIRDFRGAWRKATKAAGIPDRIPHDFRRSAVRALERAGVPRSVAMKLTGHKTESVYRRYAIVAEADLREGVKKVATLQELLKRPLSEV